ncbi:MAG TPA: imelysin family protein [Polyangiaceae bacterium]|nr:imelysin family protein [Polyangiaceae bacterium]
MQRRSFLGASAAVGAAVLVGCHRASPRERVMSAIARTVSDGVTEMLAQTKSLEDATSALEQNASAALVARSQELFRQTAILWKRVGTFRDGPFQEQNALLRVTRYPARARVIEAVLAESRPLDAGRVAELGSGEKGLYAIEYLLFDSSTETASSRLLGAKGPRARALLAGLSREVTSLGDKIAVVLGRRGTRLNEELLQNPQRGLGRLVNTLIEGLEVMAEAQLGMIYRLSEVNHLDRASVEGFASGISHRLALARLEGTERLYRGGHDNVSELVRSASPNADASVRERLDNALASLRGLKMPLEEVAQRERLRLQEAYLKVKSLETGMKVHLPSALGISITFSSTDAD